jgi:FKBP-type peptidyl-prolyl cis-trans isomerase FkpA
MTRTFSSRITIWVLAAIAAASTIATIGCTDPPTSPTPNVAFAQSDVRVGTGAEAVAGLTLSVNYTGWLYDASKPDSKGLLFDTSLGRTPFIFALGSGQVIAGWDRGVPGMKVGGIRRLIVPPSLAYGSTRTGAIPPNGTLVFDIELLSVQ